MFSLGKKRSEVGKWLDQRGITQEWLREKSRLGRNTVTRVCSDPEYIPSGSTMVKIIKALKEVDPSVSASKFWDI